MTSRRITSPRAYLHAAAPLIDLTVPLFQSVDRARRLTGRAIPRREVLAMIKRRAATPDLPAGMCCHTFRATGITAYLSNGGPSSTPPDCCACVAEDDKALRSDRRHDSLDEIERIVI